MNFLSGARRTFRLMSNFIIKFIMKNRKMLLFGIFFLLAGITATFSVDTPLYFILSDISFNNNQVLLSLNGEVKYNIFKKLIKSYINK